MKLHYTFSIDQLDQSFHEYASLKKRFHRYLSSGATGSFLLTFITFIVFNHKGISAHIPWLDYLTLFILFSIILSFLSFRTIKNCIEASINRKGEPLDINLTLDKDELVYQTQYVRYQLKIKHLKKIYETPRYFHLEWSAKKAKYLRQLGLITIPKSVLNEAEIKELKGRFLNIL